MSAPNFLTVFGQTAADPYPYPLDDCEIYLDLMCKVLEANEIYLYGILEWFRAVGIRLVKHPKWGYVIQPIIYDGQENKWGWKSIEEWNEEKKALNPYMKFVVKALSEL